MSIASVMKEVKKATQGGTPMFRNDINQKEARAIVREMKKNGVTAGEAKVLADTYEHPRRAFTAAIGEGPTYTLTDAAERVFNKAFTDLNVPAGEAREAVAAKARAVLDNLDDLESHRTARPETKNLVRTVISTHMRLGGPLECAYVDAKKQSFYFSTQNASTRRPERFYGPFSFDS